MAEDRTDNASEAERAEGRMATLIGREELPPHFFGRRRLVVGPDQAAVVIRDGKWEQTLTADSADVVGLWDNVKRWFGAYQDLRIVMLDLAPQSVELCLPQFARDTRADIEKALRAIESDERDVTPRDFDPDTVDAPSPAASQAASAVGAPSPILTKDQVPVALMCNFRMSWDMEQKDNVAAYATRLGEVYADDVSMLVSGELSARVLGPRLATYEAGELRSNPAILADLQKECEEQLRQTLRTCGLALHAFYGEWFVTEAEMSRIFERRQQMLEEARARSFDRTQAKIRREADLARLRQEEAIELRQAVKLGDEETERLYQAALLERKQIEGRQQLSDAEIEGQVKAVEAEVKQKLALQDIELDRARHEFELQKQRDELAFMTERDRLAMVIEMERKQAELELQRAQSELRRGDEQHQLEMRTAEMNAATEQLLAIKKQKQLERGEERDAQTGERLKLLDTLKESGQLDADVAKEALRQQTMQAAIEKGADAAQAVGQAESAKQNVEAYRQGLTDEQSHQRDMIAGAAKVVSAFRGPASPPPEQLPPGAPAAGQPLLEGGQGGAARACPTCKTAIQPEWNACPQCGRKLSTPALTCDECGTGIQAGWSCCPNCGKSVDEMQKPE